MGERVRRKSLGDRESATVDILSHFGSLTVLGIVTRTIWTQAHPEASLCRRWTDPWKQITAYGI